jgi:hypothetical protein
MWRLLSHLVLLATASASLVISEIADKGAADACDGEEWVELHWPGEDADEFFDGEIAIAVGVELGEGVAQLAR